MLTEAVIDLAGIPPDALEQTVALVFQTSLEQEVFPGADPGPDGEPAVVGQVHIDGAGGAAILIEAAEPVARRLAGRFLAMPPEGISGDDVRDAMGEITNMVAGNFKSAFLPGAKLVAPPESLDGEMARALAPQWQYFMAEDGPFRVALIG